MAEIEIGPRADRPAEDEIGEIKKALEKMGAPPLTTAEDGVGTIVADGVVVDVLTEFLDRLEAYDMAREI